VFDCLIQLRWQLFLIWHARATHGERAYAGHDLALGQVPMAHEPLATVVGQLVGMGP
jgi:hypothetical protein